MRLGSLLTLGAAAAAPLPHSFSSHLTHTASVQPHQPYNPAIQPPYGWDDRAVGLAKRYEATTVRAGDKLAPDSGIADQILYPDFTPNNGTINDHLDRLALTTAPDVVARDNNNNGFFDWEDTASIITARKVLPKDEFIESQANTIVEKAISNNAPFILLGENHNQSGNYNNQPVNLAEKIALQLKDKGYTVRYGLEFSDYELNGNDRKSKILDDLNKKKITPRQFEQKFIENLGKQSSSEKENVSSSKKDQTENIRNDFYTRNLLNNIIRLHKAGAEIFAFDPLRDTAKSSTQSVTSGNFVPPTRDAGMADMLIKQREKTTNPKTIDLIATGAFHARKNVDYNYLSMSDPTSAAYEVRQNITRNQANSDNFKPLATRLGDALGNDKVISVYNYPKHSSELEYAYGLPADRTLNGDATPIPHKEFDFFTPSEGSWNAKNPLPRGTTINI